MPVSAPRVLASNRNRFCEAYSVYLLQADIDHDGTISFEEFDGLLDRAERAHRIALAGLHVRDALVGQPVSFRKTPDAIAAFSLYTSRWWETFYVATVLVHMMLAFFENPDRFDRSLGHNGYDGRPNSLVTHHHSLRLLFVVAEFCFFLVYAFDLRLFFRFRSREEQLIVDHSSSQVFRKPPPSADHSHGWNYLRCCALVVLMVDWMLTVGTGWLWPRFTRAVRPLMLVARLRHTRKVSLHMALCIRPAGGVFSLIAAAIFSWSFWGFIVFDTIDPQRFGTFGSALYSMLTLADQAPRNMVLLDLFMSPGKGNGWPAIFFLSFIAVNNIVLMKLIIAVSLASFKHLQSEDIEARQELRRDALDTAYALLLHRDCTTGAHQAASPESTSDGIATNDVIALIARIRPQWPPAAVHALLQTLCAANPVPGSDLPTSLKRREFFQLCGMLRGHLDRAGSSWPGGDPVGCPVLVNVNTFPTLQPTWDECMRFECDNLPHYLTASAFETGMLSDDFVGSGTISIRHQRATDDSQDSWSSESILQLHDEHGEPAGELQVHLQVSLLSRSSSDGSTLERTFTGSLIRPSTPCTVTVLVRTFKRFKFVRNGRPIQSFITIHLGDSDNLERQSKVSGYDDATNADALPIAFFVSDFHIQFQFCIRTNRNEWMLFGHVAWQMKTTSAITYQHAKDSVKYGFVIGRAGLMPGSPSIIANDTSFAPSTSNPNSDSFLVRIVDGGDEVVVQSQNLRINDIRHRVRRTLKWTATFRLNWLLSCRCLKQSLRSWSGAQLSVSVVDAFLATMGSLSLLHILREERNRHESGAFLLTVLVFITFAIEIAMRAIADSAAQIPKEKEEMRERSAHRGLFSAGRLRLRLKTSRYLSSRMAVLDGLTCAADLVQLLVMSTDDPFLTDDRFSVVLVIRSLRIIKVLQLVAPQLVKTMNRVAVALLSMVVLISTCVYVFSVIGLELYSGRLEDEGRQNAHVLNFDDFTNAVVCMVETAFLSGRAWVDDDAKIVGPSAWIFYMFYRIVVGVFLVPAFTGFIVSVWQLEEAIVKRDVTASIATRTNKGPFAKHGSGGGRGTVQRYNLRMRRTVSTESLRLLLQKS